MYQGTPSGVKNTAVIYCRVSTLEQTENYSLSTQEKSCREYCQGRGLTVDKVFIESGQSAKTIKRTEFSKMLIYCFEHKTRIRSVIVLNVSRFSRSVHDHLNVRTKLRSAGIELRSVTEPFDDTSTGKLTESMLATFAQFDNDVRSERTVLGMKAALESKQWPFRAPLGYLRRTNPSEPSIVHDPIKGPLVRKAFEMFAEGTHTMRQVLEHVTKLGLTTSAGKKINLQTFVLTLRRPIYAGIMTVEKWTGMKPMKGDFVPLVSEDTFQKVQQILSGRAGPRKQHVRSNPDFPLRHFVRCGCCEKPLTGSWSKNRKKLPYAYYRCYSPSCKSVNVRRQTLESAFLNYLAELKPCTDFLALFEATVMDVWESQRAETVTLVISLERQLKTLEEKREFLEDAFLYKRTIDEGTYRRQGEKLTAEIVSKQIELNEAKIEEFDVEGAVAFARHMLENAATLWNGFAPAQKERFQEVIFPAGVTFFGGKFGTTATNPIFNVLRGETAEKEGMATRHGFEP